MLCLAAVLVCADMGQRSSVACGLGLVVLLLSTREAKGLDSSPHAITFVAADKDIRLEALDWGGPPGARALVFLSGPGDTAHVPTNLRLG